MARPRRPNEPSSYQPQPPIPPELKQRFDLIRAVIGERLTISEAARELSIARVNMQTLVHRAEAAIMSSLQPRSTGPAPKPPSEKQLEARVAQLEKDKTRLQKQLQAADDMMMAAGEIIRSLRGLAPTSSRTSSSRSKRPPKSSSDEDPEPATLASILRRALDRLRTKGDAGRRAAVLGIDIKTLRRWLARLAAGEPMVKRRGGSMRAGPPASEERVRGLVVELHGMPGAESLARSVSGVSRRRAAQIKSEVLTELERARKALMPCISRTAWPWSRPTGACHIERRCGTCRTTTQNRWPRCSMTTFGLTARRSCCVPTALGVTPPRLSRQCSDGTRCWCSRVPRTTRRTTVSWSVRTESTVDGRPGLTPRHT
jgi:hypothetical protein